MNLENSIEFELPLQLTIMILERINKEQTRRFENG
jgi:hypothetical protein